MNKYKVGFFVVLSLLILSWAYFLFLGHPAELINQTQTQYNNVDSARNEVQKEYNDALERLDSVAGENELLKRRLNIKRNSQTEKPSLTEAQKRMIRLIDSTAQVKDSINTVIRYMNSTVNLSKLSDEQRSNFDNTIDLLGSMQVRMDLDLDLERLGYLKKNNQDLNEIIKKFDKKQENLNKLTNRLDKLSGFLKISIDIFSKAVSAGIIVSPGKGI